MIISIYVLERENQNYYTVIISHLLPGFNTGATGQRSLA